MNMLGNKTILDSVDLGKFSQIQSISVNQKGTHFGVASFDGRANISNLVKGNNGTYSQVNLYFI